MRFIKRHPALFLCGLLTFLFALFTWPGCDGFLVSACYFEELEGCQQIGAEDGGRSPSDMGVIDQNPGQPPPPNGPERTFEWRADYQVDASHKFVGMYQGNKPLFLLNNNIRWESLALHLNESNLNMRWTLGSSSGCPTIPSALNYSADYIYSASGLFYFLRYSNGMKIFRLSGTTQTEIGSALLTGNKAFPTFLHPSLGVVAFPTAPPAGADYAWVTLANGTPKFRNYTDNAPTAILIGDLDSIDGSNGLDIITFFNSNVREVLHGDEIVVDDQMVNAIEKTIADAKPGDIPIAAAFIQNLNDDAFPELIYARSNQIFVTSYKGRGWAKKTPTFENWKAPIITIPDGETVRSISSVELTQDRYPDLIVETDKFVHFYRSNP